MSYLSALRLHFCGTFQATVSTVNNDPDNFDLGNTAPNNSWNATGDNVFRLIGCKVTAAFYANGALVPKEDPIVGALIGDSNRRVPAKLVDIDPQEQLLSTIYGLEVRLSSAGGVDWLRTQFEPASFFDIWSRTTAANGNEQGGAAYQSVLTKLEWLPDSAGSSPWLTALKNECTELAIKFNVDGFCRDKTSRDFGRGRIVGTIGPALPGEPRHMVIGRHFIADFMSGGVFALPAGRIFNCVAIVDRQARKIRLDLGNSLPAGSRGGFIKKPGELSLVCHVTDTAGDLTTVKLGGLKFPAVDSATGKITDSASSNYLQRACVIEVPADDELSDDQLTQIENNPLAFMRTDDDGTQQIVLRETPGGLYVRADRSVFRLGPGKRFRVPVYAMCYGRRHGAAHVVALLDNSWLHSGTADQPYGVPTTALRFPTKLRTDAQGFIDWSFLACDPGTPRKHIDGQIYGVRFALLETLQVAMQYPFDLAGYIGVLIWHEFPGNKPLTWHGSIRDIFTQYANLYPVMKRIVDMSDYRAVCRVKEIIAKAMGLDFDDANFMPVTRDMSPAKQIAILEWLKNPVEGTPPPPPPPATKLSSPESPPGLLDPISGEKSDAFLRTPLARAKERDRLERR